MMDYVPVHGRKFIHSTCLQLDYRGKTLWSWEVKGHLSHHHSVHDWQVLLMFSSKTCLIKGKTMMYYCFIHSISSSKYHLLTTLHISFWNIPSSRFCYAYLWECPPFSIASYPTGPLWFLNSFLKMSGWRILSIPHLGSQPSDIFLSSFTAQHSSPETCTTPTGCLCSVLFSCFFESLTMGFKRENSCLIALGSWAGNPERSWVSWEHTSTLLSHPPHLLWNFLGWLCFPSDHKVIIFPLCSTLGLTLHLWIP